MRKKNPLLTTTLSPKERKRAFSPQSTKEIVKAVSSSIKHPKARRIAVGFIKAVDLKKIRNTSET